MQQKPKWNLKRKSARNLSIMFAGVGVLLVLLASIPSKPTFVTMNGYTVDCTHPDFEGMEACAPRPSEGGIISSLVIFGILAVSFWVVMLNTPRETPPEPPALETRPPIER